MTSDRVAKPPAPGQRLLASAVLLLWCVLLLTYARLHSPDRLGLGLWWNLFLAAIPLCWSRAFQVASERGHLLAQGICFCLWLLFLPNAPYILTDLIHLGPRDNLPEWYVLAMLLSCAATGTLLGYLSLLDVQEVIERKLGSAVGWAVAMASLLVCGFGIYVGRFLRWNSWDAFTHPLRLGRSLARQFVNPGDHPHPVPVTLVFGVGLVVGYLALRIIAASARSR